MDEVQQIYKLPGSMTVYRKEQMKAEACLFFVLFLLFLGLNLLPSLLDLKCSLQKSAFVRCIRRIRVFRLRQFPYNDKEESS